MDNLSIEYDILKEKDLEQTIELMAEAFSIREPMGKCLKVDYEEWFHLAKQICNYTVNKRLSVVAKNNETVLGAIISNDFVDKIPMTIPSSFEPIFSVVEKLEEIYTENNNQVKKGELFYLFMGASKSEYSKNNIVLNMLNFSLDLAKKNGYKKFLTEPTGPISQHIWLNKLKYKRYAGISYKNFEFNGVKVFEEIDDCEECMLVTGNLV